jgi:hypothetical protein
MQEANTWTELGKPRVYPAFLMLSWESPGQFSKIGL